MIKYIVFRTTVGCEYYTIFGATIAIPLGFRIHSGHEKLSHKWHLGRVTIYHRVWQNWFISHISVSPNIILYLHLFAAQTLVPVFLSSLLCHQNNPGCQLLEVEWLLAKDTGPWVTGQCWYNIPAWANILNMVIFPSHSFLIMHLFLA